MSGQPETAWRRSARIAVTVVLLPISVPLLAIVLLLFGLHRIVVYLLVWAAWLPRGRDVLFVYSDSPIWQEYMIQQVLPLVRERAVVLNWSERSKWPKWWLPAHVFRTFGGEKEYNPLVVLFRPFCRAKRFRFWPAFKDWKHGHSDAVEQLTNDLRMRL